MAGNSSVVGTMRAIAAIFRQLGGRTQEAAGWTTRGRSSTMAVAYVMAHHTAATVDIPSMLRDGRADLAGPLCNWELRKDGLVVLLASGRANHAGTGIVSSTQSLGIEATGPVPISNTGKDAFPNYTAYVKLVAAHIIHYDWPISRVIAHKESARPLGRKVDPAFNMDTFRDDVTATVRRYHAGDLEEDMTVEEFLAAFRAELGTAGRPSRQYLYDLMRRGATDSLNDPAGKVAATQGAVALLASGGAVTPEQLAALQAALGEAVDVAARAAVNEAMAEHPIEFDEEDAELLASATADKTRQVFVTGLSSLLLPPDEPPPGS